MNINKHVTTDNLDVTPPAPAGPWAITPTAPRTTWDVVAARGAVGILASVVAWYLLPPVATGAALAIAAAWALKRFVLTDRIGGIEVRTWRNDVRATDIVAPLGQAAIEHARRPLPNVSSYSPSVQQLPASRAQVVEGQLVEPAQLPPPINVGPLSVQDGLAAINDQAHAIFSAKTKGGKSTIAKAALRSRIARGEDIFVIDPHSNGWFDLPGVGGGLNWTETEAGMMAIVRTYRERMREREEHIRSTGQELPQNHFPRITVIFDEANESRMMIDRLHTRRSNPWPLFVDVMGSGARKVGISLWMICQSPLIKDLGGSTVLQRNFAVIALDHETIVELIEDSEPVKPRREAIISQLGGREYPAAIVIKGQAFLLDRRGLDQLQPISAADCAWGGWDYARRQPRNVAPVDRRTLSAARAAGNVRASVAVPSGAQVLRQDRMDLYLTAMVKRGLKRREIREWCRAHGLRFDNDLLTRVRSDLGLSADRTP